ncbi:hypothetical protein [Rhodoluna sp.]|uniref:hypothetical protein n=1 Tax=Rhodoluna sp. TaxID=1969481 RepID=UPI0025F6C752|nr:hypothetical protein [Rhodoluna sp.]
MFEAKSGLRKLAAITAITTLALSIPLAAQAAETKFPETVTFLAGAFGTDGKKVDLYGKTEWGVTLESMIQLKAGGRSLTKQLPAVQNVLASSLNAIGNKAAPGFLTNADGTLKVGRAGLFLFASEALDVPNNAVRAMVFKKLKAVTNATTGEITGVAAGSIDYAWASLGLNSYDEKSLANKVVLQMLKQQHADGGFGSGGTDSSADATGLALQAISLYKTFGSKDQDALRLAATKTAVAYLRSTDVANNHWDAYGEASINSTAYAAMGLKAAGAKITAYSAWLQSKLAPTGGFKTSWSAGLGDVYSTSQGYVPLIGLSYLDLIKKN